jgi:hypothetical protein
MERSKEQIMIDEIMDWFDFAKVTKTMELLEWKIFCNNDYVIPGENTLRENARKLLMDTINASEKYEEDYAYIKTGPFKATCFRDKNHITSIALEFVVTEWTSDSDDDDTYIPPVSTIHYNNSSKNELNESRVFNRRDDDKNVVIRK